MSTTHSGRGAYDADSTPYLGFLAIAAGLFISAPAVVVGIALARPARTARLSFALMSLLGLVWTWLALPTIGQEIEQSWRAVVRAGGLDHSHAALTAGWPHVRKWWLLAAPLGFALALGIATLRRRTVEELRQRDEHRAESARDRAERKARRAVGVAQPPKTTDATSSSATTLPTTTCSLIARAACRCRSPACGAPRS